MALSLVRVRRMVDRPRVAETVRQLHADIEDTKSPVGPPAMGSQATMELQEASAMTETD